MMMEETMNITLCMLLLLTTYIYSKTHVMNNLIIIELTSITILTLMFKTMMILKMENYLILYFVIIIICESMLGLSLMIAMIRTHSNDYLKSLNVMQF